MVCHIHKPDFNKEGYKALRFLYKKYMKKSKGKFSVGRNRIVFILPTNIVVKIPITLAGFGDNDWEGSIRNSNDDPEEIRYARTRMTYYDGDIPIVFMEYVQYANDEKIQSILGYVPDWTMSVDCGQVGFNSRNKLVAFDYGIN